MQVPEPAVLWFVQALLQVWLSVLLQVQALVFERESGVRQEQRRGQVPPQAPAPSF